MALSKTNPLHWTSGSDDTEKIVDRVIMAKIKLRYTEINRMRKKKGWRNLNLAVTILCAEVFSRSKTKYNKTMVKSFISQKQYLF